MPNSWKGAIGGLIGSIVLSGLFLVFTRSGVFAKLDIVTFIDRLGSIGRPSAWVDHFIVGTLLWGPMFAGFDATTSERPRWQKGIGFGLLTWLAMMLIFMPVVGGGVFGLREGFIVPTGMLALHLTFGTTMAFVYEMLDARYPAKPLLPSDGPPFTRS
jgi:hypothetical protein